jgi:hypothetical protein
VRDGYEITLANDSRRERETRDQLRRVLATCDVASWVRTVDIVIEEGAVPHSHPRLTLNTRHLNDDGQLLSTFLHEHIHWFVLERPDALQRAIDELRVVYKTLPVGYPQGANDVASSYLHVVVNYLELIAMEQVVGSAEAARVFDAWLADHYTALYRIVLDDRAVLAAIIERHGLLP